MDRNETRHCGNRRSRNLELLTDPLPPSFLFFSPFLVNSNSAASPKISSASFSRQRGFPLRSRRTKSLGCRTVSSSRRIPATSSSFRFLREERLFSICHCRGVWTSCFGPDKTVSIGRELLGSCSSFGELRITMARSYLPGKRDRAHREVRGALICSGAKRGRGLCREEIVTYSCL